MLNEKHIRTHVVTIPLPKSYALPQAALSVIGQRGATLHNLSAQPWGDAASFGDGYHLTPDAARKFSTALAQSAFY